MARVRRLDVTRLSDAALKEALTPSKGDADTVRVFAIVNEAMRRRLGAWRVFDERPEGAEAARCREAASRLLASCGDAPGDPSWADSKEFSRRLSGGLDDLGLDGDARTVVGAMVYVAVKSRTAYPADILLPAAFYEALRRLDPDGEMAFLATDEQLLAGAAACGKNVVEMDAGEGKTVAVAFAAAWRSLGGGPVHVVTANDYLAARDAAWLAPVYESLGLSVGAVLGYMDDDERRDAYRQRIVYGTIREFGFDFLRDNLGHPPSTPVQGPWIRPSSTRRTTSSSTKP